MSKDNRILHSESVKLSQYNFYVPQENGSLLVFNTATGAIVSFFEEPYFSQLQALRNIKTTPYNPQDKMHKTFLEMGILVPEDRNEYQYALYQHERDIINNRELALTLITTRQCNLRCIYCYETHENLPMSEDVYGRILSLIENSLKNRNYASVSLHLFGGEPFFEYENVIDFLEKAQKICKKYDAPFGVGATTNGVLITPERFDRLSKAGCRYYQISVDGLAKTHDKYRIKATGEGSWNEIIANLTYMISTKNNFKITLRTNFNDEVFQEAEAWYKFIKEHFDDPRIAVYYEGIKRLGGEKDADLSVLEGKSVREKTFDVAQFLCKEKLKNDVVDAMTQPYSRICYASKHNNFLVDFDGTLLKCTLCLDDDLNRVGYISENGELIINETKHAKWVSCKSELPEFCRNCRVLPLCYGGRCINDRVHGKEFFCSANVAEEELSNLISTYYSAD